MRWGRGPGGRAGGGAVTSGAALSRQRPESDENGQAWPSRCVSRGGGYLGCDRRAHGSARRNSSFFDLIKVVSNWIDLIQIKDGLPKI
jgi:hypothetical protein